MNNKDSNRLIRLDAQYRLFISLAVAGIVLFSTRNTLSAASLILLTWSTFAFSVVLLDWIVILTCHPKGVRGMAGLADSSRTMIFIFIMIAAIVSLGAIVFLLKSPKDATETQVTGHVLLSMGAVIISWCMVHTIFTMRYAHMYYDNDTDDGKKKASGGLQFPGGEEPDYLDFVYFSFVLGTTFQVSDIEIASRPIRRLALVHGLISFAFNTVILALSINVVSGLVAH